MDSDKAAVIAVGTSVDVMERRVNDSGTLRLKIAQDSEMEGLAHFIALFKSDGATPFLQSCSTQHNISAHVWAPVDPSAMY